MLRAVECSSSTGMGVHLRRNTQIFADTSKGAHASGIFYSLIETAKANGIEPYAYLYHIFKALPYADTVEKVEALLPWNAKDQLTPFN